MFHTYAIYNEKHDKIYIGQTEDIKRRLEWHNNHKHSKCYTSRFSGKWRVFYSEQFEKRSNAIRREKQLKSCRGREFLKKHIKNPR